MHGFTLNHSVKVACPLQVYIRKGKMLLALQAVLAMQKLVGDSDPDAHQMTIRFCKAMQEGPQQAPSGSGPQANGVKAHDDKVGVHQRLRLAVCAPEDTCAFDDKTRTCCGSICWA